jgi:hypothetical protein
LSIAKRIAPTDAIRRSIAEDEGVAVSELTGTFQRLPVLLGVSGVPSAALQKLQHRMRKHGEDVQVYSAGSAAIGGPVVDAQFRPGTRRRGDLVRRRLDLRDRHRDVRVRRRRGGVR